MSKTHILSQSENLYLPELDQVDQLTQSEVFLLKAIRSLVNGKFVSAPDRFATILKPLRALLLMLAHQATRPVEIQAAHPDQDAIKAMTSDERLLLDLIGCCQSGKSQYCLAVLKMFFGTSCSAKARNLLLDLSRKLSQAGIPVRHRLCNRACEKLEWTTAVSNDNGARLIH